MSEDVKKLTEEEERDALYLDAEEEIRVQTHEELGGGLSPIIELLVCSKCDKCKAFEEVLYACEIGEVIEIDSIRGRSKMREYGLSEEDHPVLIANGDVELVGEVFTEDKFREWYFYKYGLELLP